MGSSKTDKKQDKKISQLIADLKALGIDYSQFKKDSEEVRADRLREKYAEFKEKYQWHEGPAQAPIVKAGDDITVDIGDEVVLDGDVSDDESIVSATWLQEEGPPVVLVPDEHDKTISRFTAPNVDMTSRLVFALVAVDNDNLTSTDKLAVTVSKDGEPGPGPTPEPTPEPTGVINISEKWATGQEVDIMKGEEHQDGDGDKDGYIFAADPRLYASHAGGGDSEDRAIIMSPDGVLSISGDMARGYFVIPSYSAEWELDIKRLESWAGEKFDKGNCSLKSGRHQFGGSNSNKNGGVGVHFGEDYVGSGAELEHGNDVKFLGDKAYPNGKKLKLGEKYHVKFKFYDEPGKDNTKHVTAWVDFNDGNGLTQVLDGSKKLPASLFQKELYESGSSIWFRNNGSGRTEWSNVKLRRL